jgi:hypothetical protein
VKKLTSTNIFTVGDEVSIASVDTNVCCWAHTDEIRRRSKVGFEGQTGNAFLSPAPPLLTHPDIQPRPPRTVSPLPWRMKSVRFRPIAERGDARR